MMGISLSSSVELSLTHKAKDENSFIAKGRSAEDVGRCGARRNLKLNENVRDSRARTLERQMQMLERMLRLLTRPQRFDNVSKDI